MSFAELEISRDKAAPVNLYLFRGADPSLESLMRSVTVIPGTTEFGYGTTKVTRSGNALNWLSNLPTTDFVAAMDDLEACAPDLEWVSLVVAWHGTDLRIGNCQIVPKVETATSGETPYSWQVGSLTRGGASVVSQISGRPALGGAPSDRTIAEAVANLKTRGWKVLLYPFIMMDIAAGNSLPNPYGGTSQPTYPWRGRITCTPAPGVFGTVDKTSAAATQVNTFFGTATAAHFGWNSGSQTVTYSGPAEWSYRRFILHMAQLAASTGCDAFLIGSEMVGMTSIRSDATTFPAVAQLQSLAAQVRTKVGSGVKISYAADWSEYHSYRPGDGSNDVLFNLDPLWADDNIDFVGIDNYMPISDWRDGNAHLDRVDGYPTLYDKRYLQANIEGGEYYDWYYPDMPSRTAQERVEIEDGAYGKDWVFRQKDFRNWWGEYHHNRPSGVEAGSATDWQPESKPIVFTEIGYPAIDKATNQPNVFYDPKSVESAVPYFSNGTQNISLQRTALEASLSYWKPDAGNNPTSAGYSGTMIDWLMMTVWTWDARPFPAYPERDDFWGDTENYRYGHWINGRVEPGRAFDSGPIGPFAYTDAEDVIVRDGISYLPVPINRNAITASGSLDKSTVNVRLPQDSEISELFKIYPPSSVINLFIMQGHVDLDPDRFFKVAWSGRVLSCSREGSEAVLTCEPISRSMKRNVLRRNYQIACPFVLYGTDCRASKKAASKTVTLVSKSGVNLTLPSGWPQTGHTAAEYIGGMVEWLDDNGVLQVRSIRRVDGNLITVGGATTGLSAGDTITLVRGCDHKTTGCNQHDNILNYGGQLRIPVQNPFRQVSIFY